MHYLPTADPHDPENWARAQWLEKREYERTASAFNHGYIQARGGKMA